MKPDPNYPRMMFHRSKEPVIVYSEDQEAALGPEWTRKVVAAIVAAALPKEDKPLKLPDPEPEKEPDEEYEWEEPEEEPAKTVEAVEAPPAKPKRVRPAAHKPPHKPPHKTTAHKRG